VTPTIVFAPDSFKGTATAADAAVALATGWASVRPNDVLLHRPMADGGEGTIDAFVACMSGSRRMPVTVVGPDDRVVDTCWLLLPDNTGVVELANTSGITLLDRLRPLDAHSQGFGEACAAALRHGVTRLLLAIGGSASTDGGAGMLTALGARFRDADGHEIVGGNRGLATLATAQLTGLIAPPRRGVVVLCDVTNPVCGDNGSAAVFGPQKGALTPELVALLESGLTKFVAAIRASSDVGSANVVTSGAGAAGGVGFGLLTWGATLVPGSAEVARMIGLAEAIRSSDAVITGEGSFDTQSALGKVPAHVVALTTGTRSQPMLVAGRISAPTGAFLGSVSLSDLAGSGDAACARALYWLEQAGARLARQF
jgi:glycerate 2-kinase